MTREAGPVRKLVLVTLIGTGVLLLALSINGYLGDRRFNKKLHDRRAHWQSVTDSGVQIGEPQDAADAWLRKTVPSSPGVLADDTVLVASAETLDPGGWRFPCSAWIIQIEIGIGPDRRVVSRDVRTIGMCL